MQKVFGGILLGCGILIAGVSGLCSLIAIGIFATDSGGGGGEFIDYLGMFLMFGGIPLAIGIGMFLLGRSMLNAAKED